MCRDIFNQRYGAHSKLLVSGSPKVNFVESWHDRNLKVAIFVLLHFLGYGVYEDISDSTKGAFEALCFEAGIKGAESES